jgi:outer membrane protein TolC
MLRVWRRTVLRAARFPQAPFSLRRKAPNSATRFSGAKVDTAANCSSAWRAASGVFCESAQQRSLKLAEASYDRDKRSLELGALPPLDIYRSQSEVAARKVEVIQAAYALTQAEEALRLTIGADRDPQTSAMEFSLTESPETEGELENIDLETSLNRRSASVRNSKSSRTRWPTIETASTLRKINLDLTFNSKASTRAPA